MAVKIRLARSGAKKCSYFKIVVANNHAPRDGAFIEKVGYYNPLLSKDNQERVVLKTDRVEHWLAHGAQPTERVIKFIQQFNITLPLSVQKKLEVKLKSRVAKPPKEKHNT
ncbi:ribosomal protein S16 [Orientia chuto str. Dubai]|uniref:Small ribosomal subunit protein bS16 n=1 Tax=Orientia chuto str. Dubai TaxID=1359168 RepID=A0A0F3MK29_9RICK|nr:30S ribosomal protein S16 [Candidatus Orientia mediorientalis]KJV56016.1 ribosomal protein S16 [Orientia chuto str. Dubai]